MKNSNEIKIYFCKPAEFLKVVSLTIRAYNVPYKPDKMIIKARETVEKIKERTKLGTKILVAKRKNRILGAVRYRPIDKTQLKLSRLAVLPRYRCKGVGSLLVDKVISIAKREGYKIVSLDVAEEKGLIPFYKNFGFKAVSRKKHHNHHDVCMEKKI